MVDYALQRRALLAEVHSGRVGVAEVCDASPYLLRAARFHGEPSEQTCPVCRKERLTLVSWIFGDALKHAAGSARKPDEIEQLANSLRRLLRVRGGGVPYLQLEPPGAVLRDGHR